MATKNIEKINFNVTPALKKEVELLASSYNKNLSVFMVEVCTHLVKNNAQRIKEQKARASEPINFGDVAAPKTVKKKAKSTGKTTDGGTPSGAN